MPTRLPAFLLLAPCSLLLLTLTACLGPLAPAASRPAHLEKAIAILQLDAKNPAPDLRANCIEGLQYLKDPRATGAIEQGLRDPEWVVRFAAAMATGKRQDTALKPTLRQLLRTEPNGSVKVAMTYALHRMGDSAGMNTLAKALEDPDPEVRANTALVLGLLGDPTARGLLNRHQSEKDVRAKFEITVALARLGDRGAQDAIMAMSLSKWAEDRFMAIAACPDIKRPEAAGIPLHALKDPTPYSPVIAARALGRMGSDQGRAEALAAVSSPDPRTRYLAALALGEILGPTEDAPLAKLMEDPDDHVRIAAAAAEVTLWARAAMAPEVKK